MANAELAKFVEDTKTLAKISKRLEELKAKLEGGQLKVDDLADSGVEYKVLKKAYDKLLYSQDMVGSLVNDDKPKPTT
jgi:pimeloyl-CoA synthetase